MLVMFGPSVAFNSCDYLHICSKLVRTGQESVMPEHVLIRSMSAS